MPTESGRSYLAIPGPSVVPDRVLRAMHRPAPNIYEGELVDMVPGIRRDLRRIARTTAEVAIYIANGHGAWEAALANVTAPGDRVLVLASGLFGLGWGRVAQAMGREVEILDFGPRAPAAPEQIEAALRADRAGAIGAVLAVQVDTSTSVRSDMAAVRRAIDAAGHPALLMVDSIACLGCDAMAMDDWGVDVLLAASQKGLMVPAGLAFLWFGDRADAARGRAEGLGAISPYWDWRPRVVGEPFYRFFSGTAPAHHLYGLRAALDMIFAEGLDAVLKRHARLARAVWAACEAWGAEGPLRLNVAQPEHRSHAVTAIDGGSAKAAMLRDWLEREAEVTLGIGLGMAPAENFFRIGHMGHVNAHMVMGVLGTLQAGLEAVGIEHGPGALDAAARRLA